MSANLPAKTPGTEAAKTIGAMLRTRVPAMAAILPKHLTAERLARIATYDIARTPALLKCEPETLVACVLQAAALGLEPGIQGHAYLVPYGTKCTLIIGYRGMVELARRSGQVATVQAFVIHEKDEWDYALGLAPNIRHVPADAEDPGKLVAAYAVAKLKSGETQWELMRRREIDAIMNRSKASGSGPWRTDYEEMAKKTVLRRLCKLLPMSIEHQAAIEQDAARDASGTTIDLSAFDAITPTDDPERILEDAAKTIENEQVAPAAEAAKAAASKARKPPAPKPTPPPEGATVVASGATTGYQAVADLGNTLGVKAGTLLYLAVREGHLPDSDTVSLRDLKPAGVEWAMGLLQAPDARAKIEALAEDYHAQDQAES